MTVAFDDVAETLVSQNWTFAKTMPHNPHFWTLRKTWSGGVTFNEAVAFIRSAGYVLRFGRTDYLCLDVGEFRYWSMGAPVHETTLINRAKNTPVAHCYDRAAPDYDKVFSDPESLSEDDEVFRLLGHEGGSVLDIGCGTGMALKYFTADGYLGLDPSSKMLHELERNHPGAETECTPLWRFATPRRFALVMCLFGSANYMDPEEIKKIVRFVAPGGRFFVMIWKPDYVPVAYDRIAFDPPDSYAHSADDFPGVSRVSEFGDYLIIEGAA